MNFINIRHNYELYLVWILSSLTCNKIINYNLRHNSISKIKKLRNHNIINYLLWVHKYKYYKLKKNKVKNYEFVNYKIITIVKNR